MNNFASTVAPPGDATARVHVTANVGTQAIGAFAGPLDATDPGEVQLTVRTATERATITFTDLTFAAAVRDALTRAIKVADTRDYSLDKPREDS